MRITSPSTRRPFRTFVLGAAITAVCAGGDRVTARAHGAAPHERGFSTADESVTPELAATAICLSALRPITVKVIRPSSSSPAEAGTASF
jgi:hypothetical protein